jgi:hypothetical protein
MSPRRRIDSVLAQTCGDFEAILSDDSTASRGRCPRTVIGEIPRNAFPPPLLDGYFGMRTYEVIARQRRELLRSSCAYRIMTT